MATTGHHPTHEHPSPADHAATVEAALDALRAAGGRITGGRRAIVTAVLSGDDHHVTADDLAGRLQRDNPSLAVSTVYRTLEALEEIGFVTRVDLGQGRAVYHPIDHRHHHLVCTMCGALAELGDDSVGAFARRVEQRTGFDLGEHLTLYGTCADCTRA